MKRLFIGIILPKSIIRLISTWRSDNKKLPVRWTKKSNLHITLIPPWYTKSTEFLRRDLERIAQSSKVFKLNLFLIDLNSQKEPKYIWLLVKQSIPLNTLKSSLEKLLIKKEGPRFKPHVTIARLTKKNGNYPFNNEIKTIINWPFTVSHFELIESILGANSSKYRVLERFYLKNEAIINGC